MSIKLMVEITPKETTIQLPENAGILKIVQSSPDLNKQKENQLFLVFYQGLLVEVGQTKETPQPVSKEISQVVYLSPSWELELNYLVAVILNFANENNLSLVAKEKTAIKIPINSLKVTKAYWEQIQLVLTTFGFQFINVEQAKVKPNPAKPGKPRHRWTKEVAEIEFNLAFRTSEATVFWHKRNEMLIKAGATMMVAAPLNKDGSLGFAAKMGDKLRSEQAENFTNFKTTKDIILKSVNEVGLFLYFGGTNSWLELKDAQGKSLNEWTVVLS